jgi:hypothetical protein
MNSGVGIGTREEKVKFMLVDVLWRLDAIDERLRSSQPRKASLTAREGTAIRRHRQPTALDPPLRMLLPHPLNPDEQARRVHTIGSLTTVAYPHGSNLCCSSPLNSGRSSLANHSAHWHWAVMQPLERAQAVVASYSRPLVKRRRDACG